MKILFLSYWGLNEGLTAATVFPHVSILAGFGNVEKVLLVTIERTNDFKVKLLPKHPKISHEALISNRPLPKLINKIYDFIDFPKKLITICKNEEIDILIARGSPPGALALKVSGNLGIPFYVESFEPHSEYMLESGTWKWYDPRYLFQKRWEKLIRKKAKALMPVSEHYKQTLINMNVPPEKIDVMPCCVDADGFLFNIQKRKEVRKRLGIGSNICGIYCGKFGGLYLDSDSFRIFKIAQEYYKNQFFLLILTSDKKKGVIEKLKSVGFDTQSCYIDWVNHNEVPDYLSAADFAFTLIKPKKSNLYCSPIKNGEYLASGLPIIITREIGDDSDIIEKDNAGSILKNIHDSNAIEFSLNMIKELVREVSVRQRLHNIAKRSKSFQIVVDVYRKWYT